MVEDLDLTSLVQLGFRELIYFSNLTPLGSRSIDEDSEAEFDDMLQNLQADWEERESRHGDGTQSFFRMV